MIRPAALCPALCYKSKEWFVELLLFQNSLCYICSIRYMEKMSPNFLDFFVTFHSSDIINTHQNP